MAIRYCPTALAALLIIGLAIPTGCSRTKATPTAERNAPANKSQENQTPKDDESDAFFSQGSIAKIQIQLSKSQERKLRNDPREYVRCTFIELDGAKLDDVGIKLKGAAGSFQELDDKPAFTINVGKYQKQQVFHGLSKFHLNNSVQDETYTGEWLCASICKDAGIPAPRVSHARVWLNGKDLGMYVFKESFDQKFVERHFSNAAAGNLYDGGFLQDIDADLEKDVGSGGNDRKDLDDLVDACSEEELEARQSRLEKLLNVDAFLTVMAFETMVCHWDGYVSSANNYRLYFPSDSNGARFLPHGMDQVFQETGFPIFQHHPAMVARAVRSVPEWNHAYRKRVEEMLPLFESGRLGERVSKLNAHLRSTLLEMNPDRASELDEQLADWKNRLAERYANIQVQLSEPDPPPPEESMEEADERDPPEVTISQ